VSSRASLRSYNPVARELHHRDIAEVSPIALPNNSREHPTLFDSDPGDVVRDLGNIPKSRNRKRYFCAVFSETSHINLHAIVLLPRLHVYAAGAFFHFRMITHWPSPA
jgi:hypothetical protein